MGCNTFPRLYSQFTAGLHLIILGRIGTSRYENNAGIIGSKFQGPAASRASAARGSTMVNFKQRLSPADLFRVLS